jgi:hypothetical protein
VKLQHLVEARVVCGCAVTNVVCTVRGRQQLAPAHGASVAGRRILQARQQRSVAVGGDQLCGTQRHARSRRGSGRAESRSLRASALGIGGAAGVEAPLGADPGLLTEEWARAARREVLRGLLGDPGEDVLQQHRAARWAASALLAAARASSTAAFHRAMASGLRRIDWSWISSKCAQRWCPFTRSTPSDPPAARCPRARRRWLEEGQLEGDAAAVAARCGVGVAHRDEGAHVARTLDSQRAPTMIASCVSAVAPFHEIFTSEVTGRSLGPGARTAAREGAVGREVELDPVLGAERR